MAKRHVESVYRIVDVVGESATSWEEAGRHAVETAATSIRDLRVAEVVKMDMKVENGKVPTSTPIPTALCGPADIHVVLKTQTWRRGNDYAPTHCICT